MANGGDVLITADPAAGYELKAPDGAPGLRSPALDTRHGPDRRVVVPSAPTRVRGVEYLTRAARDSDESLRFKADGTENPPTAFYPFQRSPCTTQPWPTTTWTRPPRSARSISCMP
ncbi:hypothetical protein [Streptomyces europaeiscabiei]|uniref:hypothetical protein n=1 Tax=Streptomyces europaeiscabiei TaxID=146819 RepID=UPI0029BB1C59|nr:hypothetical protein [Streptomyces europaeiscabiei]MDX3859466.1 hypothetical protein [Streptomyces europaeiscabiei]MDX3873972.1 hypothetical protein [Streptomyces europaeiscabiei]